jgi:hypothetical protein
MGSEWDTLGRTEPAADADGARPVMGVRGTCSVCEGEIHYIDSPYGGWWSHFEHPADGHDAELRIAHEEAELP